MINEIISSFFIVTGIPIMSPTIQFADKLQMVADPKGTRMAHAVAIPETNTIILRRDHWEEINYPQRRELIWHELIHLQGCTYHSQEPENIMNPFAPDHYWVHPDGSNWPELVRKVRKFMYECKHGM